jgi:hypothetical protein
MILTFADPATRLTGVAQLGLSYAHGFVFRYLDSDGTGSTNRTLTR